MAGVSFDVVANMDKALATIKRGTTQISDWVTDLGKKQIPWDEILTGALDPAAIVGEIMTLFATATLAAGEFQTSLQGASADAASSFGDNLGTATNAAISLSEKTGISAGDAASTLGVLSAQWTDTNMQMAIGTDAATLAAAGLGSASDIASQFSEVLKTFGITDVPTAQAAMVSLYTAARNSGMSFNDFMGTIISNGPALAANNQTIQGSANALASLATQSGMTASVARSSFASIAQSLADPTSGANMLLRSIQGVQGALSGGDLASALQDIVNHFQTLSATTVAWGQAAGFDTTQMDSFHNTAVTSLDGITKKAKGLADTENTLGTNLDAPMTSIAQLQVAWNKFEAQFLQSFGPMGNAVINWSQQMLSAATAIMGSGGLIDVMNQIATKGGLINLEFEQMSGNSAKLAAQQALQSQNDTLLNTLLASPVALTSAKASASQMSGAAGRAIGAANVNSDQNLLSTLIDALKTGNIGETNTVSSELNLNIGTINSNSKPQDVEAALYKALYNKFQTG